MKERLRRKHFGFKSGPAKMGLPAALPVLSAVLSHFDTGNRQPGEPESEWAGELSCHQKTLFDCDADGILGAAPDMVPDRMKDEFISTLSHELRTPLTSIRGALGLLAAGMDGRLDEKASKLLRIALSNSDRLLRLVNDILDLERIQSGCVPPAFRRVQLGELVRQAIEGMEPIADAAGVLLIYDAAQAEVAADPDRLLQVLTNLLSNAVKFSWAGSAVTVALQRARDGVMISVRDEGRGIPAENLDSIFGRFQQVDADDCRRKGGSGLGLAICRTIVQQHSGRIWAERNRERGSTFRVFLPWQPAPFETAASDADAEEGMLPFEVSQ